MRLQCWGCCQQLVMHPLGPLVILGPQEEVEQSPQLEPTPGAVCPPLPSFKPTSKSSFVCGECDSSILVHQMDGAFEEVVMWRRNCFKVPHGRAGKSFVQELSRLFSAFASASTMEAFALKAATLLPLLVLQKLHRVSKTREHIECLQRCLALWTGTLRPR